MKRLQSECILCILNKQLAKLPVEVAEEERLEFLQRMSRVFAEAPLEASAPLLVKEIDEIKKALFHIEDEYGEIKRHFNQLMLGYEEIVRENISKATDQLKAALQYSLVGNYIDFGAMKQVDEKQLISLIETAGSYCFDRDTYEDLQESLAHGERMLYLTDNCGEIVMDKLLIETIQKLYPQLEISVMVRGIPVLNDATMEDAEQVGLTDCFSVYGNGTGIAGTCVEQLSEEARKLFEIADIVMAKGQGNFETLRFCGKNVFYLFLCKCDMFARQFQVPKLTGMLVREASLHCRK